MLDVVGMNRTVRALEIAYGDLSRHVQSVSEEEAWLPTGCMGWAVRDLIFHLHADAQRGLVALATTTDASPDRDAVTYWATAPTGDDAEFGELRATRSLASTHSLSALKRDYSVMSQAAVMLAQRSDPAAALRTQGLVLSVDDLITTLVVEAAVHHLDLVAHLPRPGPAVEPLALVRETLDGLLGAPEPVGWDDTTYALAATGRRPLTQAERDALGPEASRFPLLS